MTSEALKHAADFTEHCFAACHFTGVLAMLLATALVMLTTCDALVELQNQ